MLFSYFSRVTQHTNDISHMQKYILCLKITRQSRKRTKKFYILGYAYLKENQKPSLACNHSSKELNPMSLHPEPYLRTPMSSSSVQFNGKVRPHVSTSTDSGNVSEDYLLISTNHSRPRNYGSEARCTGDGTVVGCRVVITCV